MNILARIVPLLCALSLGAQTAPPSEGADPWKAIAFLQGTWEARTTSNTGVTRAGTYTFRTELGNHILARHSTKDGECKGPAGFDCDHSDLLYVYQDAPGQPLKAIYFDNKGHVLHYDVSAPDAATAIFLSDDTQPGPQFRLIYRLTDGAIRGKFQVRTPAQPQWKSYLEWSGPKRP